MISITKNTVSGKYDCVVNGVSFSSSKEGYIEYKYKQITGSKMKFAEMFGEISTPIVKETIPSVDMKFSINARFGFVENVVQMVASGVQASAVITGEGGLGKSFTVLKTLKSVGVRPIIDLPIGTTVKPADSFIQIKGFSTAKGLYRSLYENNGSVIIFDDCDSILKDPVAINILKGALDSYDQRIISWNAEMRESDDLPKSFVFTGKVIFISNLPQSKIDQAIRSRSILVDLTMTTDQKLDRMSHLVLQADFMEEYSISQKQDALNFIVSKKNNCKEISLRTLITVAKIRSEVANWENLAEYVICK
jgi:hypothetical protein